MTLSNCKRLLKHYQEVGNSMAALDMSNHIAKYRQEDKKASKK